MGDDPDLKDAVESIVFGRLPFPNAPEWPRLNMSKTGYHDVALSGGQGMFEQRDVLDYYGCIRCRRVNHIFLDESLWQQTQQERETRAKADADMYLRNRAELAGRAVWIDPEQPCLPYSGKVPVDKTPTLPYLIIAPDSAPGLPELVRVHILHPDPFRALEKPCVTLWHADPLPVRNGGAQEKETSE